MNDADQNLQDQEAIVQGLRVSVYSLPNPAVDEALLDQLAQAESQLKELKGKVCPSE